MICVLSWLAVLIWWPAVALLPRRPARPGVCRQCGYSLTGNVSGICPECGTPCGIPAEGAAPPDATLPRRARLGPLFGVAVALTAAAVLTHVCFVVRYLPFILRPDRSPYGHENAFGDAPRFMGNWALVAPAVLCGLAAGFAGFAVVRGWARDVSGGRFPLALWSAHLVIVHYLVLVYFDWFFD